MPGQGDDYFKPLNWLKANSRVKHRCLPVDGTQQRFDDFTAEFTDPDTWIDQGQVVLVTGDKGFGKTSLMQRCAAWLRDQAEDGRQYRLFVVDLSDARWAKEEVEVRMTRTLGRMLDELGMLITSDDRTQVLGRSSVADAFYAVGVLLESLWDSAGVPIVIAVLLEGYPIPAEVTEYYNIAGRGMVFFAEIFRPGQIAEISDNKSHFNRNGADFHVLQLSAVKADDLRTFADWIKTTGNNLPEFSDSMLDEIARSLILQGSGVLELARMMLGALEIAAKRGATIVSSIHIAEYYAIEAAGTRNHDLES